MVRGHCHGNLAEAEQGSEGTRSGRYGRALPLEGAEVLHRGIATRPFRQTFNLAEHVKVTNATFEHGLLIVELKREVPEALKPRRIEIATRHDSVGQTKVTTLEHNKA
jgi:molecular chaperone IbpA